MFSSHVPRSQKIHCHHAFHVATGSTLAQYMRQLPRKRPSTAMSMLRSIICRTTLMSTFKPDGPKTSLSIPIRKTSAWLKGWKRPIKEMAKSKSQAFTKNVRKSRHQKAVPCGDSILPVTFSSKSPAKAALTTQQAASSMP